MKKVMLFLAAAAMMAACCNKQETVATDNTADVVMQNILSRKSVRSYTGDTIPAATLGTRTSPSATASLSSRSPTSSRNWPATATYVSRLRLA